MGFQALSRPVAGVVVGKAGGELTQRWSYVRSLDADHSLHRCEAGMVQPVSEHPTRFYKRRSRRSGYQ